MSLYAIGDLHLHFQSPLKAKAQDRDRIWKNHEERFRKNRKPCESTIVRIKPRSSRSRAYYKNRKPCRLCEA